MIVILINILLTIFIVYSISNFININNPYIMALVFTLIFIIFHCYLSNYKINNLHNNKYIKLKLNDKYIKSKLNDKYKIPDLNVDDETFEKNNVNYYGTVMPLMGPLDGLTWDEIIRRVNYLKIKTQYPYRPITYTDFKTSMDELLGNDLTGLLQYAKKDTTLNKKELSRWYPNNTINHINARDCTNYSSKHPYSCIQ